MDDKMLLPFSRATGEAFRLLLDLDVSAERPETIDAVVDSENKVNIVIGVTGDLTGEILYRFPKETALEMVKIMCGMEIEEIDDFVTSAMGEIANIISGNAMTGLSEQNITCDIKPPRVIVGGPALEQQTPVVSAKLHTGVGDVELDAQLS